MKSKLVLLAVCCVLSTVEAQVPWGGESQRSRAGAYALEGLGALGGVACAACCGGAAYGVALGAALVSIDSPDPGSDALKVAGACVAGVCAAALPAASGYGAAKVGEELGEDGSTGWAIGGAYAGTFVGAGLAAIGGWLADRNSYQRDWMSIPFFVAGGLSIPVGAVAGYNLGTPRATGPFGSRHRGRIALPAMALTSVELPDHSVEYGVKVQLAGLRF